MIIGNAISPGNGFAGGSVPAFLDNSKGAWSITRGIDGYTGNLIKVRRDSDNATMDIGVLLGVLDEVSLLAFVGAGSGFVRTIFSQKASTNDAEQSTASSQGRIVNLGVVEKSNGLPAMFLDGVTDFYTVGTPYGGTKPASYSQFFVFEPTDLSATKRLFSSRATGATQYKRTYLGVEFTGSKSHLNISDGTSGNLSINTNVTAFVNTQTQISVSYSDGDAISKFFVDGGSEEPATVLIAEGITENSGVEALTSIGRGGNIGGDEFKGYFQEAIIYEVDNIGNRATISDNQKTHYSIP
jgi:hypothetical protein